MRVAGYIVTERGKEMLISEKGLARCLNRAYKRKGYTLQQIGNDLCIYTESWFVRMPWKNLPRKALAVIVEHAGYTYVGEDALYIIKGEEPQTVMPDVVGDDLDDWLNADAVEVVTYVPALLKGLQLYQVNSGAGNCYGVPPEALELLDGPTAFLVSGTVMTGERIKWRHEDETVLLRCVRGAESYLSTAEEKKIWRALEGVNLHPKEG